MLIKDIADKLNGQLIVGNGDTEIHDFYVGDFLSRVMGRAPSNCGWFTVMGNINAAGVAVLAEVKAVILCEGVDPNTLKAKLEEEGIALISTTLAVFECCKRIA